MVNHEQRETVCVPHGRNLCPECGHGPAAPPMANGKQGEHEWTFLAYDPSWGYCSCGRFGTQDRSVTLPVWQAHIASLTKSEYDFGTPEQVITGLGAINEHNAALAAPPVEDGLEGQAADIAERWIRIRILRDAPQEMIDSLKDFIVERFRNRDRELVEKLKGTIQTIREFEAHSNESGDPVGGCVKCLRLFDALLKRADELRAVLAARKEGK